MKEITFLLGIGVVTSLVLSINSLQQRSSPEAPPSDDAHHLQESLTQVQGSLAMLQQEVNQLKKTSILPTTTNAELVNERLEALESGLTTIQNHLKTLDFGEATAEREALFRGDLRFGQVSAPTKLGR